MACTESKLGNCELMRLIECVYEWIRLMLSASFGDWLDLSWQIEVGIGIKCRGRMRAEGSP